MEPKKRIRICYIAGREETYPRTRIVLRALKQVGYEVVTCLPRDKSFKHYPRLILEFLWKKRGCDLILVGFYGQLLMPFVWLLSRKPILYDMYVSTYEVMVLDRAPARRSRLKAWAYYLVDKLSLEMASKVILETNHHIARRVERFGIDRAKFERVFLAADDTVLHPLAKTEANGRFLVHFHGEFAPFHGVRWIIEAAKMLEEDGVHFQIIGRGQTYKTDRLLADRLQVKNITFIDRVDYEELAAYMSKAEICLGIFGDNPRAMQELTNKVVEALAVGRPVVTAKNQPTLELLQDGHSAVLVEPANAKALAEAICHLKADAKLRHQIAKNGREVYLHHCSLETFSYQLSRIIEKMVNPNAVGSPCEERLASN